MKFFTYLVIFFMMLIPTSYSKEWPPSIRVYQVPFCQTLDETTEILETVADYGFEAANKILIRLIAEDKCVLGSGTIRVLKEERMIPIKSNDGDKLGYIIHISIADLKLYVIIITPDSPKI